MSTWDTTNKNKGTKWLVFDTHSNVEAMFNAVSLNRKMSASKFRIPKK